MLVEVCIDSVGGARAALDGGADRLEVCSALELGGLTPSYGLLQAILEEVPLPLMAMVRPRSGDFCYDELEIATMEREVMTFRDAGVSGVVFGCLRQNGTLDERAVRRLLAAARPATVTFHRAIDVAQDVLPIVDRLAQLGIDRILSSGQAATAEDGLPTLRRMITVADGRLVIMPGGGIGASNVCRICRSGDVVEIHCGAGRWQAAEPGSQAEQWQILTAEPQAARRRYTSADSIRSIRAALAGEIG